MKKDASESLAHVTDTTELTDDDLSRVAGGLVESEQNLIDFIERMNRERDRLL